MPDVHQDLANDHEEASQVRSVDPWLVVFDLDGTLIDSSEDLTRSVNAALRHVGAEELSTEVITSFVGDGAPMLLRRALFAEQHDDRVQRALQFFLDYYRVHKLDHTLLYEGVFDALTEIRRSRPRLPMAVLTNKPVRPSVEICEALGIAEFFFAIRGGNSFQSKKPDPEGLRDLMARAGQGAGEETAASGRSASGVVLVGDSDVDVLTARNAGARSLGCTYGLAPERLLRAHPDMVCDTPAAWCSLLFQK